MITSIIKRDGREVAFTQDKITDAIVSAFRGSGSSKGIETAQELSNQVVEIITRDEAIGVPTVEQIQDVVERVLIENGFVRTAKAFILYRADRSRSREMNTRLMKIYEELTFQAAKDSDIKRENANINADTPMGMMLKYGSEGAKQFNEMFAIKPAHAIAHREGDIQIHDMEFLMLTTTCCQIDILKLFDNGFCTGHGVLREPKDIASYSALCCIAIQANQNDQHGGQAIPNFDYGMAQGVKKTYVKRYRENLIKALELLGGVTDIDEKVRAVLETIWEEDGLRPELTQNDVYDTRERTLLEGTVSHDLLEKCQVFAREQAAKETDRATYQAMEALIHNLNTMNSRAGAQVPFSSINYGMDTSAEGRMVVKNLLLSTEKGLGNGETPIFPIQIFRVMDGVSGQAGDINYDLFQLACRVSAKRLFPNFSFMDAPFNKQYYVPGKPETEIAYMGCRTRVMGNVYDPKREIAFGRGNLSFTSINLPRMAIKAAGNVNAFFEDLDRKMDLVIDQMMERYEIIARKTPRNYPFLMGEGVWIDSEHLGPDDEVREVLKHGTLSMGFIGLAEALKALTGSHHGQSVAAQNLGLEIIGHMRARMDEESARRKMNFTLIATPGEGLSGRFVRIDREKFGSIEGVTDREYYTNSFHIPVYYPINALEKIEREAPYHTLTNAGHITYVELDGDPSKNLEAFEAIVTAMKHAGVGYGSINHPVDRDPVCSYNGIIGDTCPNCGREEGDIPFARIRRITGYLVGTLDRFNNAKRAEESQRVKHGITSFAKAET